MPYHASGEATPGTKATDWEVLHALDLRIRSGPVVP